MKIKIVTPERTVYESEIDQATLPVSDGEVTILPNHCSYIASMKSGEIVIKKGKEEINIASSGGFLEFNDNNLIVLADAAEHAEEIDLARAEKARQRAEEIKAQAVSASDEEYARVAASLERSLSRIKVAKKHLTKRGMKIEE